MKKKVLFIHYGGGIGGAPVSMIQLMLNLDKSKYDIIAVFSEPGPIVDYSKEKGIKTIILDLKSAFFYGAHVKIRFKIVFNFFVYYIRTINIFKDFLSKEKPDLVYLNTSVLLPVGMITYKLGYPIIWHVREVPGPNNILRNYQIKKIKKMASHIIVNSNFVKKYYEPCLKLVTVYNGLDLDKHNIDDKKAFTKIRSELKINKNTQVICMVGSVQEEKGHFLLIDIAKKIINLHQNILFLIIAGGVDQAYRLSWKGKIKKLINYPLDNRDRMKRLILSNSLEKNFIFTGYRFDIPQILAASNMVAFLSQKPEGFGRPIIEAMASARPIIATDIGPSRELIGEKSGLLVSKRNVPELVDAIMSIIQCEDQFLRFGKYGRERANKFFNQIDYIKKIERIIEKNA
tara:strand:- start:1126 stop:2331 length:1206 start_codon:yes stop_codon:yes gene_type:complete